MTVLEQKLRKKFGSPNWESTAQDRDNRPVEGERAGREYRDDVVPDSEQDSVPDDVIFTPSTHDDFDVGLPAITGGRLSRKKRFLRALARLWQHIIPRKISAEERQYLADVKARQSHEKELLQQAIEAERRIVNALVEIGVRYEYKQTEKGGGLFDRMLPGGGNMQKPSFDETRFTEQAIYLRFKTPLPRNVGPDMILSPDTLTAVSAHVRRRVTSHFTPEEGLWYIVELNAGVRGIPRHVMYADMMERFPKAADGLYIPFGQAANKKPIYISLGKFYHMLVGGTTGSGKSNFLEVVLCTLLRRNGPARLRLLLIDLKRGVQFSRYEGVPHLITDIDGVETGIITRREEVVIALEWLHAEGERRLDQLREQGYQDIDQYNSRRRGDNKLSHVVAVFDEIADLMMDPDLKRNAERLMANILGRHRAAGLHLILCTQNPRREVIPGLIKANCPLRVAFSVPNNPASMVILDNIKAVNLGVVGRAVVSFRDEVELQVPLITTEIVEATVEGVKGGEFKEIERRHDVTPLEIMEWSLSNFSLQGKLPVRALFDHFSNRGLTKAELIGWLEEWENKRFVIGSTEYVVDPSSGNRPRALRVCEEQSVENNAQ
jgi:hypothetical protein